MTCTYCTAPTATGMYLCDHCADNLYETLNRAPELLAELGVTKAKLDRTVRGNPTSIAAGSVLPVRLDALEVGMHLEILLMSWARMLNDYAPKAKKRKAGQDPVTYLRSSVNVIRGYDFAGPMFDELHEASRDAFRLVDLPRDIRILGTCELLDEDTNEPCPGKIKTDGEREDAKCNTCGAVYSVAALEAWNRQRSRGELMSVPDARRWLNKHTGARITYKDLRNWMDRGHLFYALERVTTTERSKRLIYTGDALRLHHRRLGPKISPTFR